MKNSVKSFLTLFLCLISNVLLFAQTGLDYDDELGDTDELGTLEGQEEAVPIDNWIGLLLVLGLILGYYILKNRKQILAR